MQPPPSPASTIDSSLSTPTYLYIHLTSPPPTYHLPPLDIYSVRWPRSLSPHLPRTHIPIKDPVCSNTPLTVRPLPWISHPISLHPIPPYHTSSHHISLHHISPPSQCKRSQRPVISTQKSHTPRSPTKRADYSATARQPNLHQRWTVSNLILRDLDRGPAIMNRSRVRLSARS